MAHSRNVPVIVLGLGNVGSILLRQILDTRDVVARRKGLRLVPVALADISGVLFDPDGLPDDTLHAALHAAGNRHLLDTLPGIRPLDMLESVVSAGAILADVTAATQTAPLLHTAISAGCGVVLANKNPLIGTWPTTQSLFESPLLRYECTVGAGLPVIDGLFYLLDTGDEIVRVEGCLSGTLGYLCGELERGVPYSNVVAQARALGYTEPDPRDDLSGHDVARKALILARTAGWPLEMADLSVEALYPESLAGVSIDEFLASAYTVDSVYAGRFAEAQANGHTLRYVAQVGPDGATVGLQTVPQDGPMGALSGPANYIALTTRRYNDLPMVFSGPGAGPDVTAAGVLGNMLDLAQAIS